MCVLNESSDSFASWRAGSNQFQVLGSYTAKLCCPVNILGTMGAPDTTECGIVVRVASSYGQQHVSYRR